MLWDTKCEYHVKQYEPSRPISLRTNPAGQEIPCILWNPKLHYSVHKGPPFIPIMSQMSPVHSLPIPFFKIHFDSIVHSILRCAKWSLFFRFFLQNPVYISPLYLLHAPPTSSSSTGPLKSYSVSSTNPEAPHYAVFSNLLSLPPSQAQISSSAPSSQTLSAYVLVLM